MATSPVESFSRNISSSGSGFDAKLQALVGIGQAVKQSQVAKQRMQDQFQQQKDLIQFRSDTQLNKQLEYYDRVTRPQQEAQAKQQALQNQSATINESREAAMERKNEMLDEFYDNFDKVNEYGLYKPYFRVQQDKETGLYEPKIFVNDGEGGVQEVDEQQYRYNVETLQNEAEWFSKLEEGLEKGWFPEELPEGEGTRTVAGQTVERLTRQSASDIVRTARRNPEMAARFIADKSRYEIPSPMESEMEEGEGGLQGRNESGIFNSAIPYTNINEITDQNGFVEFNFVDQPTGWNAWNPFAGEGEVQNKQINLGQGQTISGATQQVQEIANDMYGIDLSKVNQIADENVRSQILRGNTEGLSGDEEDLADKIADLKSDEQNSKYLDRLFKIYFGLPQIEKEWRQRFSPPSLAGKDRRELYLNFGRNQGFSDIFVPASDDVTANKAYFNSTLTR